MLKKLTQTNIRLLKKLLLIRKVEEKISNIYFTDKIKSPIIINIGLQDNVCPPETGYALFSSIGSKQKKLFEYDGHGHEAGRYIHTSIVDDFFAEHLKGDS